MRALALNPHRPSSVSCAINSTALLARYFDDEFRNLSTVEWRAGRQPWAHRNYSKGSSSWTTFENAQTENVQQLSRKTEDATKYIARCASIRSVGSAWNTSQPRRQLIATSLRLMAAILIIELICWARHLLGEVSVDGGLCLYYIRMHQEDQQNADCQISETMKMARLLEGLPPEHNESIEVELRSKTKKNREREGIEPKDRRLGADVITQLEYYLSDANLDNDSFLRCLVLRGKGWISLS